MVKPFYILLIGLLMWSCKDKSTSMEYEFTNDLVHESSPYLLQHAHNPVDWKAWNDGNLKEAKKEDKLLIISIGYASCHWCHVMEEECFEDREVAELMNNKFISIKIDREERPDVDQVYMDALQLMTGQGGWPLNVVALPDGKPIWGATYLPKDQWMESLNRLAELYETDRTTLEEYAGKLSKGVNAMQLLEPLAEGDKNAIGLYELDEIVVDWSQYMDTFLGGYKQAPKFMMPNNLDFLLHYGFLRENDSILNYVHTSLTRMAYGGIFDPIGGGFSRYSVDVKWHIPHFEKMLYDNAQLISLYSKAFAQSGQNLYRETAVKCIDFIQSDLKSASGGYYSSLDADSKNQNGVLEEGSFYVWEREDLNRILGDDYTLFSDYYNVNSYGQWEDNKYVLIRDKSTAQIAEKFNLKESEVEKIIEESLLKLKKVRDQRSRPRLDDKILTSWNALYLQGLIDASRFLNQEQYLDQAIQLAEFIDKNLMREDGGLYRNFKDGKASIPAFLDDYATLIEAYLSLFELSGAMKWLQKARDLTRYCDQHFSTPENDLYFYTEQNQNQLIRRSIEVADNVISSSNSIMMKNLIKLQKFYFEESYGIRAQNMLLRVRPELRNQGQGYANWLHGILYTQLPFYEIALVGPDAETKAKNMGQNFTPNSVLVWGSKEEGLQLSLLKNRWTNDQTLIYVCQQGSCKLPVQETKEALAQLGNPYLK